MSSHTEVVTRMTIILCKPVVANHTLCTPNQVHFSLYSVIGGKMQVVVLQLKVLL